MGFRASQQVSLTDGRWVGLRQPLAQGAGPVVHILLLAREEGVLVEGKALAEVAYQALETYEEIVATEMIGLDGY